MENYERAEKDYMAGMKYKDIAEKYETTINTVKSWKKRYGWERKEGAPKKEKVCKEGTKENNDISWVTIEHEYVTDIRKNPCTLDGLANKYNIPLKTIKDRSVRDGWVNKRTEYVLRTCQKAKEKSSNVDADRIARLLNIADIAADKAEQALGELEQYIVKNKRKVKTVEYKDATAIGKPTKEVIDETEEVAIAPGPIDRLGLSQITTALKNIKDMYALPIELEDKKYKAEYDKKRAEVNDNTGEEILKNMKTITDILQHPVDNRDISDFEGVQNNE